MTKKIFTLLFALFSSTTALATATMAYDSSVSSMSRLNPRFKSQHSLPGFTHPKVRSKAQILFGNLERMGINRSALATMAAQSVRVVPTAQLGQAGCIVPETIKGQKNPYTGKAFQVRGCVANGQIIIASESASGAFGVVIHELGHTIDHFPPRYQLEQLPCASRINHYVQQLCLGKVKDQNCGREIFAETFTAYVGNPGRLRRACPGAYELMRTHLFNQ